MPKPPNSPPSSDIEGVDRDARRNTDSANDSGQDTSNLALARDEAAGKPDFSEEDSRDDRSR